MQRDRLITIIAACSMVLFMAASVSMSFAIESSASRNKLVYTDAQSDSDRPEVSLGMAMGAFRGLFVNYLWIRANELKEEGKYYEAVDLARAITRLQPRFPRVWVFHAWNLAYNISVATQTDRERWNWVRQGIDLLRKEGIPANPHDALIHKELAWIFFHKVQGFMDDAHWTYKREHALEWTAVMGRVPRRSISLTKSEELVELFAGKLEEIIAAPRSRTELARKNPVAGEIANTLESAFGIDLNNPRQVVDLLLNIELRRSELVSMNELNIIPDSTLTQNDALMSLMLSSAFSEGWHEFIAHLRHRLLVEEYNMSPQRMLRFTRKYGPLDWRHAAAHSLYWAATGVEEQLMRTTQHNQRDAEILNTDRLVIHSIQELYRTGLMFFDPRNPELLVMNHNVHFIPVYEQVLDDVATRGQIYDGEGRAVDPRKRIWDFYTAGYENFLADAIRYLYRRGDVASAREYYNKLRNYPGQNVNRSIYRLLEMSQTLEEFVANQIRELEEDGDDRTTSPHVALGEINGAIDNALLNGLLAGNNSVYRSELDYARLFHQIYTSQQVFNTWVNAGGPARLEFFPRDFNAVVARQALVWIANLPPTDGSIVFRNLDEPVQRSLFETLATSDIRIYLHQAAQQQPHMAFEVLFPAPLGMTAPPIEQLIRAGQERQNNRAGTLMQ